MTKRCKLAILDHIIIDSILNLARSQQARKLVNAILEEHLKNPDWYDTINDMTFKGNYFFISYVIIHPALFPGPPNRGHPR